METGRPHAPAHAGAGLPAHCPACGMAVRGDASWCLRCFQDLTPTREPAAAPVHHVGRHALVPDDGAATGADPADGAHGAGAWGTRTAPSGPDLARADAEAERLLAELAVAERPTGGLWARVPTSRGGKALLGGAGVLVVAVLGVALMALFGHAV